METPIHLLLNPTKAETLRTRIDLKRPSTDKLLLIDLLRLIFRQVQPGLVVKISRISLLNISPRSIEAASTTADLILHVITMMIITNMAGTQMHSQPTPIKAKITIRIRLIIVEMRLTMDITPIITIRTIITADLEIKETLEITINSLMAEENQVKVLLGAITVIQEEAARLPITVVMKVAAHTRHNHQLTRMQMLIQVVVQAIIIITISKLKHISNKLVTQMIHLQIPTRQGTPLGLVDRPSISNINNISK